MKLRVLDRERLASRNSRLELSCHDSHLSRFHPFLAVVDYTRVRRLLALREAEGYLDLASCTDDFPLSNQTRDRLAQRALTTLAPLNGSGTDLEEVHYLTGQAYRLMTRHHEAIPHLERAAELNRDNIHVWLALGWCQKRIGRLDLAIQSLEEALSLAPDQAIIYYNLACYWSLAQNAKLALTYLARAFDIDPTYRDLAACEPDFNPIRHHRGFVELTSVVV